MPKTAQIPSTISFIEQQLEIYKIATHQAEMWEFFPFGAFILQGSPPRWQLNVWLK